MGAPGVTLIRCAVITERDPAVENKGLYNIKGSWKPSSGSRVQVEGRALTLCVGI